MIEGFVLRVVLDVRQEEPKEFLSSDHQEVMKLLISLNLPFVAAFVNRSVRGFTLHRP